MRSGKGVWFWRRRGISLVMGLVIVMVGWMISLNIIILVTWFIWILSVRGSLILQGFLALIRVPIGASLTITMIRWGGTAVGWVLAIDGSSVGRSCFLRFFLSREWRASLVG
jgi:hypothetical protein